eukprot:768517-Hanusia_phi.AAC.5
MELSDAVALSSSTRPLSLCPLALPTLPRSSHPHPPLLFSHLLSSPLLSSPLLSSPLSVSLTLTLPPILLSSLLFLLPCPNFCEGRVVTATWVEQFGMGVGVNNGGVEDCS